MTEYNAANLIGSFIKAVPRFSHFIWLHSGMRQGLQGETRAQREGDLQDHSNICSDNILTHLSFG
jgi:hypothetical protein